MIAPEAPGSDLTKIYASIEQGYVGLDPARAAALSDLLQIRQVKTEMLQADLAAASAANDTDAVAMLGPVVDNNTKLVAMLKRDVTVAGTQPPAAKSTAVMVHGYVWQAASGAAQPVANAQIGVFQGSADASGRLLAKAKTNAQGYFKLSVPVAGAARQSKSVPKSKTDAAAAGAPGVNTETAPATVVLALLDPSGGDALAVQGLPLTANTVVFREVVLTSVYSPASPSKSARPATSQ